MTASSRRVLITGSNRGLGRAIATAFAERGDRVAALNRTLMDSPDVSGVSEVQCDLAAPGEVASAMRSVIGRLGGLDVCVLNAAVRRLAPLAEMDPADWDASVATNLTSLFTVTREALPAVEASGGTFIIIGSHAASHAFEGGGAYCATKAAAAAFARVLALETRPLGVRTVLVSPGAIRNRPLGADDDHKIRPESLARLIIQVADAPPDLVVHEIDVRPADPVEPSVTGIARLQPC